MRGFTLVEVLLSVAMIAVLALLAPALFSGRSIQNVLAGEAQKVADTVYEARSAAMAGKNNARQGVHFTSTGYTLFQGSTFNISDPDNVARTFPTGVTATAITISGGGADIIFASSKGVPVQTGSVTMTDSGGAVRIVSINAAGMISIQ